MRIANVSGRLNVLVDDGRIDVESASDGRFAADPQAVYARWDEFRAWAATLSRPLAALDTSELGPPAPRPRQVFAVGLNYAAHVAEGGRDAPPRPLVFTKFPSCLTGPYADVTVGSPTVDWEVELVAVVGRGGAHIAEADGWDALAGITVGQDISERTVQMQGAPPQFSLGKSFPGFGPTGPWLVTPDELTARDDLEIGCSVDGEEVQAARTSQLMFSVPQLVEAISAICPLLPGDLIFTGTPSGVGMHRTPPRFLRPGNVVRSWIGGVGEMRNTMVGP